MKINNPVLTGFNPDPCLIYVNGMYYMAVSTFEWFPGVAVYSSKNLAQWELIDYPLKNISQLNMKGVDSSGGIWAPAISYSDGLFYLVYTNVISSRHAAFRDGHNYYVTTDSIESGIWSEPVYLNSGGFDPSIFHETDGTTWVLNTRWNYRFYDDPKTQNPLTGIIIQQLDRDSKKLTGPITSIFKGTELKYTEAPHLYRIGSWYYLITAEGGTSYNHAVSCARSRSLLGPYELHPGNPILTSDDSPDALLQKAGHGSLCHGHDGNWYMAHLCGRPIGHQLGLPLPRLSRSDVLNHEHNRAYRCMLGRETAIQNIEWVNDWPVLSGGGRFPSPCFEVSGIDNDIQDPVYEIFTDFNDSKLPVEMQTLRLPFDESVMSLKRNPGRLTLSGRDSPGSRQLQTVTAVRQKHFCFEAETAVEFSPENLQQMAGMMYRYNEDTFYYVNVTYNEDLSEKVISLMVMDNGSLSILHETGVPEEKVYIKIKAVLDKVLFFYSLDRSRWISLGSEFDATIISDEYIKPYYGFTGAFICLGSHDWSGQKKDAKFDFFRYTEVRAVEESGMICEGKRGEIPES